MLWFRYCPFLYNITLVGLGWERGQKRCRRPGNVHQRLCLRIAMVWVGRLPMEHLQWWTIIASISLHCGRVVAKTKKPSACVSDLKIYAADINPDILIWTLPENLSKHICCLYKWLQTLDNFTNIMNRRADLPMLVLRDALPSQIVCFF